MLAYELAEAIADFDPAVVMNSAGQAYLAAIQCWRIVSSSIPEPITTVVSLGI